MRLNTRIKASKLMRRLKRQCYNCESRNNLEFHHVIPIDREGRFPLCKASYLRVKEEVQKCIVLCGNCHSQLHGIIDADRQELLKELCHGRRTDIEYNRLFLLRQIHDRFFTVEKRPTPLQKLHS